MSVTVYGIKNCDTMQKAMRWLEANGIAFTFHDYREAGIGRAELERWCSVAGWEKVLNRAGTTFRKLPEEVRTTVDQAKAIALMLEQPGMIKRPVLEGASILEIGFKPERYAALFGK